MGRKGKWFAKEKLCIRSLLKTTYLIKKNMYYAPFQIPKVLGVTFGHYFAVGGNRASINSLLCNRCSALSILHVDFVKSLLLQALLSLFYK